MKPKIEEIIVVEGRDDTAAIKRAVDATTIETHGFGMSKEMWQVMENANATKGLIVFTDPDHGGRSIRKNNGAFSGSKRGFSDTGEGWQERGCGH